MGIWQVWAWLCGCTETGETAEERNDALVESMVRLEAQMSAVRDAVVHGDLSLSRARAAEISASQKELPPGPEGAGESLRLALAEISGAKTLAEAALGVGRVAETCATCHAAQGIGTSTRPVWKVSGVPAEMGHHAMDIDRLWLALIRPSSEDLASAVKDIEQAAASPQATGIDLRLRDLAVALRDAPPAGRSAAYGSLLEACASCHSAGKTLPRPKIAGVELPPMADTMDDHFVRLIELELAVIGGELADVHQAATAIATAPSDVTLPPQALPFLDEIRANAKRAAAASTLPEAAQATSALIVSCGRCHTATGGGPKDSIGTAPAEPHMARHVFGAYWMAYGLFAPDERAWVGGTKALLEASLLPDGWQPPPGGAPLDKEVHTIAEAAAAAVDVSARAEVLGQLLAACSPCHRQLPH